MKPKSRPATPSKVAQQPPVSQRPQPVSVLVFYSRDDLDEGAKRAKVLAAELTTRGTAVQLVHKLGFDLDQLHLVAKYRVVSTPSVVILRGDKVVMRQLGVPSAASILRAVDTPSPTI